MGRGEIVESREQKVEKRNTEDIAERAGSKEKVDKYTRCGRPGAKRLCSVQILRNPVIC
jgi:hypothetical protein